MAFGRLERPRGSQPMSEINMTPLIDVMLVLLVIFMLTAPLLTSSLKLDLPKTEGTKPQEPDPKAMRIALTASGELLVDDEVLSAEAFEQRLAPLKGGDTEVHLKADRAVPYGRVAEVLGLLQKAELHRIAFMADPAGVASAP
ncbi:biopolymer transporter ExbD [Aquabacterium soli]|uniref:Biopolymer transporter ExbD n=1 Tax=Aquabacterium soli TaxID=2493092 RepID=A0A3R8S1J5_9BURK|nr:biopolymer transporter ExbD [Aquabacterium soli]RRS03232.1 biopolymer transporter ExbD [Aquabacterium soli]